MNVTVRVPQDLAARFQEYAEAAGLPVDQWLLAIAEQNAPSGSIAHLQETDPREWARQFHEWAESHDRTTPLLSDEAISRESIYPDRA